ncbi:hypothetical protein [Falsibacillus albus]|uniref:Uncharacterized protein n=1 Tax=Falsibacillus albus TaxID=2478915 RepID=A0A3L7JTZ5_9BACI|nr:hypothetical protein [Falsibacillus albus]RLQ93091.1 hypothetical protein D9X91_18845 [Falsibacillus albus]
MFVIEYIPVPFFILDFNYQILDYSDASLVLSFDNSFMDLVDKESQAKVSKMLSKKEHASGRFEVNLIHKDSPVPVLYEISFTFLSSKSMYYVTCIQKIEDTKFIRHQMNIIREQLMQSDSEKFDQYKRKDWIQFFQPVLSDMQIANMLTDHKSLNEAIEKIGRIQDLFGVLKPDIIESGKIENLIYIEEELADLKATLDFYATLIPISKSSFGRKVE